MHACFTDTQCSPPSAGAAIRPYEIIWCSIDLWLTDGTVCGAGEILYVTSTTHEILIVGEGISRVNIFSTSLIISIFSLSFFPCHPLDATLMHLFCSIEHIGMADFPCLSGALDQKLILQVCCAPQLEKKGWERAKEWAHSGKGV